MQDRTIPTCVGNTSHQVEISAPRADHILSLFSLIPH